MLLDQLMVTCLKYWEPKRFERSEGSGAREGGDQDFLLPDNQPVQRGRTLSTFEDETVLMYVPRVLCFTSRLSYVAQHKEILTQLYHYYFSPPASPLFPPSMSNYPLHCPYDPCPYPNPPPALTYPCTLSCPCIPPIRLDCCGQTLEATLLLLLEEVPLPEPGSTPVDVTVGCRQYRLFLPASELDLPHVEFDVCELFQVLDVECVLMVMRCILSEMRIILYSSSMSLLHSVSECLIALCFPVYVVARVCSATAQAAAHHHRSARVVHHRTAYLVAAQPRVRHRPHALCTRRHRQVDGGPLFAATRISSTRRPRFARWAQTPCATRCVQSG